MQGATGSGRTWQRRSVPTTPFFAQHAVHRHRPCRQRRGFPPRALRLGRSLTASRFAHSALRPPSRRGSTAGEASRRRPGLRRLRRGGQSTRLRPSPSPLHQPLPQKPHPHSRSSRIPQIPQGAAFLPGGQLERPLPWPGRARLPVHLRVLRATTPAAVLSPPRATRIRIRSRTACNRRAAPLPSIVGAGSEDPCAICPEICGVVTRLEPYVATRRGGGRLAEGSSSHISWCVHWSGTA